MEPHKPELPFAVTYLLVLAFQLPVWLCGGLVWAVFMVLLGGLHPVGAFVGGLGWAAAMWVIVGNLLALGLAWRRSAELPAPDRAAFRAALARVCGKLRLVVLAESPDEVVLGPKRVLIRFRLQEVRVEFTDGAAVLTAPALSFGTIRRRLARELAGTA
jgi:hypothetical protein